MFRAIHSRGLSALVSPRDHDAIRATYLALRAACLRSRPSSEDAHLAAIAWHDRGRVEQNVPLCQVLARLSRTCERNFSIFRNDGLYRDCGVSYRATSMMPWSGLSGLEACPIVSDGGGENESASESVSDSDSSDSSGKDGGFLAALPR